MVNRQPGRWAVGNHHSETKQPGGGLTPLQEMGVSRWTVPLNWHMLAEEIAVRKPCWSCETLFIRWCPLPCTPPPSQLSPPPSPYPISAPGYAAGGVPPILLLPGTLPHPLALAWPLPSRPASPRLHLHRRMLHSALPAGGELGVPHAMEYEGATLFILRGLTSTTYIISLDLPSHHIHRHS